MYETQLIGAVDRVPAPILFGADGAQVELVGTPEPVIETQVEAEPATDVGLDVLAELEALKAKLAALTGGGNAQVQVSAPVVSGVPKNHRPVKANPNRKYVRLGPLNCFGKVPQQQRDIADLLSESMDIGAEWTEEEVFTLLEENFNEKDSLKRSKQSASYLFCYYRGLKNDGKHAGFVPRGFLRQVG